MARQVRAGGAGSYDVEHADREDWRAPGIAREEVPLVIGAGAIGLSAVAALAARGIEPTVISDLQPARLETATTFGADVVVNATERSPYDVSAEASAARDVSSPAVVFECVGAPGLPTCGRARA